MPANLCEDLVFSAVGTLAAPDVLVAIAADRIELDRDGELGHDDVGPHLEPTEKR